VAILSSPEAPVNPALLAALILALGLLLYLVSALLMPERFQ
jgi:K+-transporting ATPase KdpF subunit